MEGKLKELENKRDDRDRLQKELGSPISRRRRMNQESAPVMKVPLDLLARIFLLVCLPDADFIAYGKIQQLIPHAFGRLFQSLRMAHGGIVARPLQRRIFFPMHLHRSIDHIIQPIFVTAPRWRHVRLNMSRHLLNVMVNTPLPNPHTLEIERDTALLDRSRTSARVALDLPSNASPSSGFACHTIAHFSSKCPMESIGTSSHSFFALMLPPTACLILIT